MSDDVNERFAAWLKAERQRAGMSQDKLSAALRSRGVTFSQSQIAKVERGERGVELSFAVAVTAIFGATPDVALGFSSDDAEARRLTGRRTAALYELRDAINAELAAAR